MAHNRPLKKGVWLEPQENLGLDLSSNRAQLLSRDFEHEFLLAPSPSRMSISIWITSSNKQTNKQASNQGLDKNRAGNRWQHTLPTLLHPSV